VREVTSKQEIDVNKTVTAELTLLEVAAIYAVFADLTTESVRTDVEIEVGEEIANHIGLSSGKTDVGQSIFDGAKAILERYGLLEGRD